VARLPADPTHRFGYGMEIYFWTFVIAMLVLLAGGGFSVYQGLEKLAHPSAIVALELGIAVLLLSALFEGASFRVAFREYRRIAARYGWPRLPSELIQFIKWSKDPNLYESLLEDGAALVGLAIAAAGIVASAYLGAQKRTARRRS
jgi:hypothetical protein